MTSEVLREAADRLDALVGPACAGPWMTRDGVTVVGNGTKVASVHVASGHTASAAYIAAMSPTVGKALAVWLRAVGDLRLDWPEAVAVARAILGGDA